MREDAKVMLAKEGSGVWGGQIWLQNKWTKNMFEKAIA